VRTLHFIHYKSLGCRDGHCIFLVWKYKSWRPLVLDRNITSLVLELLRKYQFYLKLKPPQLLVDLLVSELMVQPPQLIIPFSMDIAFVRFIPSVYGNRTHA
jgi:hypothetical protein